MTLKQWADNGWLKAHKTSSEEIGNLLAIVDRDLKDAVEGGISADWRFGIAYNAALKLCTILLFEFLELLWSMLYCCMSQLTF